MTDNKTEQIDLEYMVSFPNGLRPNLFVYGIDDEAKEVYSASVHFGVVVGAGTFVNNGFEGKVRIDMTPRNHITQLIFDECCYDQEFDESKHLAECREKGWNAVKVKSSEHLTTAVDRYRELYLDQFKELSDKFLKIFQEFMAEHPGYGYPNESDK